MDVYIPKQKMGACSCNVVEKTTEEVHHEIEAQQPQKEQTDNINKSTISNITEKKRGKNAFVIDSESLESQDNVQYPENAQISEADRAQISKALKKHFIISQLSPSEVECFTREVRPCVAAANTYIFKHGDKSGSYYIILEGMCQMEVNSQVRRTLTYGDSFGDLGIIYSAPRSSSVLALTACQLVEINRQTFKKVMQDINQLHEQQTKKLLEMLTFFKDLTEQQKNAIASICLTQTYTEGQVIFSKGDAANSCHVIKEGIVIVKEKKQRLRPMDCFGQNSILIEGNTRSNTLFAKTNCVLLSISRSNIKASLGDSLKNIIKKNLVWRVIEQSKLHEVLDAEQLRQVVNKCEFVVFKKGEVVFRKGSEHRNVIYVLLNTQSNGTVCRYEPNSVLQVEQVLKKMPVKIKEDMLALEDGLLAKIDFQIEPLSSTRISPKQGKRDSTVGHDNMQISDFHVVRKLREGNFGKVYVCWHSKTKRLYAIKVIDCKSLQKSQIMQYTLNQEQIMQKVPASPFIVGFYQSVKDPHFKCFIMEYVQGIDLFDVITHVPKFTLQQTAFLVSQVILMIQHLHCNHIVYRDLKPENLMVGPKGYLVLVDMGTAKKLKIDHRFRTNTIIGTPQYMAPEIITGKGYSFAVDMWSIGVLTYELLCGKLPFGQHLDDPFIIYKEIMHSSVKYPRNCSKDSKNFIQQMLNINYQQRIGSGFEQLKKCPFFRQIVWEDIGNRSAEAYYKPSDDVRITKADIEKTLTKQKNVATKIFAADRVGND